MLNRSLDHFAGVSLSIVAVSIPIICEVKGQAQK